jgi:hypothetical protein
MSITVPIRVERLSDTPIRVMSLYPGGQQTINIGAMAGPPGPLAERKVPIPFLIESAGGAPISPGIKGDLFIPYDCTIVEWWMFGDQAGNMVVDILRDVPGAFPPGVGDSIVGGTPPKLINQSVRSGDAADWQKVIPANSVLRYSILSADTLQRVTIELIVERQ